VIDGGHACFGHELAGDNELVIGKLFDQRFRGVGGGETVEAQLDSVARAFEGDAGVR
jgi:hypothetical protein